MIFLRRGAANFGHQAGEINWTMSYCTGGLAMIGITDSGVAACGPSAINSLSAFGGSPAQAVYVDSSGNVGIGTTIPGAKLEITNPTSGVALKIGRRSGQPSIQGTADWLIMDNIGTGPVALNYWGSGDVVLANGGGDVGIGTASPGATLDVVRGTATGGAAIFRGTTRASHFSYSADEHTYIRGGKANSYVLINDNGGNVGIGTGSPGAKLHVAGDTKIDGNLEVTGTINGGLSGGSGETNFYTAVLGLKTSSYCPAGWELNTFSSLKSPAGYLNIIQTKNMMLMGGPNSIENWQEYIRTELVAANQVNYICSKTFESEREPYVAVFMSAMTTDKCPSDFTYVPASELKRNDGWSYFHSVEGNFYMGGLNNWWRDSQQQESGGWQGRQWNTHGQGICYNIMNVEGKGTAGTKGIFPVVMTLKDASACPAGFDSGSMADLSGTNGYNHIIINDNSVTFGAVEAWWGSNGENKIEVRTHKNWASTLCWKYFETVGEPRMDYRVLNSGSCPSGFTSIDASQLIGSNNAHGHIISTPYGSYMGSLDTWNVHSFDGGSSRYWFDSNYAKKICFKIDNVL